MKSIIETFKKIVAFFFLLVFLESNAFAGMTISGTRIIFPGAEREYSVRTTNRGNTPALVQVWVDDGSINSNINSVKVPFTATPPVFRVEPGKGQSVRLIYNGMTLPQDRESVFWFNLLEIPPVDQASKKTDHLELAFRTRIKIFYRPATLKATSSQSLQLLRWQLINQGSGKAIRVENPTPYYFSFESASVKNGNLAYPLNIDMVAPFSNREFVLAQKKPFPATVSGVDYRLLNDYGAAVDRKLNYVSGNSFTLNN